MEMLGNEQHVYFSIDATRVGGGRPEGSADAPNGVARVTTNAGIRPGDRVRFSIDPARLYFFDPDTGVAVPGSLGAGDHSVAPQSSRRPHKSRGMRAYRGNFYRCGYKHDGFGGFLSTMSHCFRSTKSFRSRRPPGLG